MNINQLHQLMGGIFLWENFQLLLAGGEILKGKEKNYVKIFFASFFEPPLIPPLKI
jgi:hypothetical protein